MQKQRFWILLALLVIVAMTVAACGGAATPAPAEPAAPAATEAPAEPEPTAEPEPEPEPEMLKAVVGSNAEYPPFESVDDAGNIVGFDIDIVNAIAEAAGIEIEFSLAPNMRAALKAE